MVIQADVGSFTRGFAAEDCVLCGKCMDACQYLGMTLDEARRMMREVVGGPRWYRELDECIRCGKCDHRCARDAHPSEFHRESHEHKRRETGKVPSSMAFAINGLGTEGWGSNFFQDVYTAAPGRDRRILLEWATPKNGTDLMWVGCGDRLMPRILGESPALRDLPKFGGPDDCCGVWAIQGGLLDEGYRTAKRLVNRLAECGFDRLVTSCGHCRKVLTKILPESLGIELPYPVISIYDYFLEKIESGRLRVQAPSEADVAISDSCFGCENGDRFLDTTREMARAIGMSVSELPHNRQDSLCCGFGGLFNDGKIAKVAKTAMVKRRDYALSGKKRILSYCPGCHLVNHYFQPGYRSHYLLEDVLMAIDGSVSAPFSVFYRRMMRPRMAWDLLKAAPSGLIPGY